MEKNEFYNIIAQTKASCNLCCSICNEISANLGNLRNIKLQNARCYTFQRSSPRVFYTCLVHPLSCEKNVAEKGYELRTHPKIMLDR